MKRHEQFLLENKAWAAEQVENDPEYFARMADNQSPDFLWIGCSDSRVSPNDMTQQGLGQLFIHRNIANLVVHTDMNLLSVTQYAVEVLKVKHIVVCGHYGCGGVKAALGNQSFGLIDQWLRHIKDVHRLHETEIQALPDEDARVRRLVELNVVEQLMNVAKLPMIQRVWKNEGRPNLHGWVYDLKDGIINPVLELTPETKFASANDAYAF